MRHFVFTLLLFILNVNTTIAFDSIITSLDFDNNPSIDYYRSFFKENDFYVSNDTVWLSGEPRYSQEFSIHPTSGPEFYLTLNHTPMSRHIYNAAVKVVASRDPFVSELLKFYTDIIKKYGLPDSAYYRPDDSNYMSSDKNVFFSVDLIGGIDTTKVKQFFEQSNSKPFGIIWSKDRFYVNLEVRDSYSTRYSTDFYCTITDKEAEIAHIKEMEIVEEEIQAKKNRDNIILGVIILAGIILLFFIGRLFFKAYNKSVKVNEAIQKDVEERRTKQQREVDAKHEENKKLLTDKYGEATRIISDTRYDSNSIKHYSDIYVFEVPKKILFDKKEYDFADILSCSLYDENKNNATVSQVTRTNTGSMLGRAAVGGLTLGVAGAVVGALTAKSESTSSTANSDHLASYVIKIGVKSIEKPTMALKYGNDKSKAEEVYTLMQAIIAMK